MSIGVGEWLDEVAAARKAEIDADVTQEGYQTTARELLNSFGRERRGRWVVADIRNALEKRRLRTDPDFEFVWIDDPIWIVMDVDADNRKIADPTIRVRMLDAANNTPVSVKRDDPLAKATTIMRLEDYSQLPVMPNERVVKGVVSWKSIGAAHAQGKNPSKVRECMFEAHVIDMHMPLAEATGVICQHDYVLVRGGKEQKITGIVTAVDLALHFKERTHPFLLIGEIEHHLRNLIRGKFSTEELIEAADGDERVRGPDDLTFGGYCRLLQRKEWWARLQLEIDHNVFKERLDAIRQIRNHVMHFSPRLPDASEIRQIESMAPLCRTLTSYDND